MLFAYVFTTDSSWYFNNFQAEIVIRDEHRAYRYLFKERNILLIYFKCLKKLSPIVLECSVHIEPYYITQCLYLDINKE